LKSIDYNVAMTFILLLLLIISRRLRYGGPRQNISIPFDVKKKLE